MTVIVWRDGILAADSMTSTGYGIRTGYSEKVRKIQGTLGQSVVAFSGRQAMLGAVIKWLDHPRIAPPAGDYTALVYLADRRLLLVEDGAYDVLDPSKPRAAGAGAEFAYGALAAGASATEAVRLTIENCVYCGGDVNAFDCKEWKKIT